MCFRSCSGLSAREVGFCEIDNRLGVNDALRAMLGLHTVEERHETNVFGVDEVTIRFLPSPSRFWKLAPVPVLR